MRDALALYVHWPFCRSKCPYCDFNSRAMPDAVDQKECAQAYMQDIAFYAQELPGRKLTSLYFGGGTPSLMEAETVEAILNAAAQSWTFAEDMEITLEANPSSATKEKLVAFQNAGVNRISLGVQSFEDSALEFLGRAHNSQEACQAIERVASLFDRFSFDLIYARKDQTMSGWGNELEQALSFAPKHLSLYQLTIEPRTVFYKQAQKEILVVDEGVAADMYEYTQERLTKAGLAAYEVSNHATRGEESRHNLTYWHYDDYIGIGAGAHGRFVKDGKRFGTEAERNPTAWLSSLSPRASVTPLTEGEAQQEALMMGLRLFTGIDKEKWQAKFGVPLEKFITQEKRAKLQTEGFLVEDRHVLRLTPAGMERLNAILAYL